MDGPAVRGLVGNLSLGEAVQVWSFSNLGRYVPGKIWQVVGLVVIARDFGVRAVAAGGIAVVVTALVVGAGAVVGIVLLPQRVVGSVASLVGIVVTAANEITQIAVVFLANESLVFHPEVVVELGQVLVARVTGEGDHALRLGLFAAVPEGSRQQRS